MIRIANRDARRYVQQRQRFYASNMYATPYGHTGLYVVYSFGPHFPIWIWVPGHDIWVGNKDKMSRTSTRHQTQTHPLTDVPVWFDTTAMRALMGAGPSALPELIVTANLPACVA